MAHAYFSQATFDFLDTLAANNQREWFHEHKADYEACVRTPALNLIADVAEVLPHLSPNFLAIPKKVGGSLMRVYRDTRFGKDKTPYKTNIGIQFRHSMGKDVHAPGYYLHISTSECFLGAGIWRPDGPSLGKIRDTIIEKERHWITARDHQPFQKHYQISGESLKTAPRGYAKDHPLIEDLRRKDFIAIHHFDPNLVCAKNLKTEMMKRFADATPYMRFLCQALALRFD
ncbi:MAG: DUF2461 domain-containing protein [Gammaproteobacteria bacterium]|nr:DUF2461 domain-containing protein [Gammaproteobacteria bacterium]